MTKACILSSKCSALFNTPVVRDGKVVCDIGANIFFVLNIRQNNFHTTWLWLIGTI